MLREEKGAKGHFGLNSRLSAASRPLLRCLQYLYGLYV